MEAHRARHHAHEVDLHHFAKSGHLEFGALIERNALAEHQNIETVERQGVGLKRCGVRHVDLRIMQAGQIAAVLPRVIRSLRPRSPHMDLRTACEEVPGNRIADSA